MLLCVDVHYEERAATAACVGFSDWSDADPAFDLVLRSEIVPEPYEAGLFYKREMPHLRRAIDRVRQEHSIDAVLVDAHVWLRGKAGARRPSLRSARRSHRSGGSGEVRIPRRGGVADPARDQPTSAVRDGGRDGRAGGSGARQSDARGAPDSDAPQARRSSVARPRRLAAAPPDVLSPRPSPTYPEAGRSD